MSKAIEARIERLFGYRVSVFIRDAKDIQQVMNSNSILSKRKEDPTKLHVTFLYRSPTENAWDELVMKSAQGDEFIAGEKEMYIFCPNGYGRTKWTNNYFEKKLRVAATTRNWKTINTLYAMAAGQDICNHAPKN